MRESKPVPDGTDNGIMECYVIFSSVLQPAGILKLGKFTTESSEPTSIVSKILLS